ncbi:alanine racemase [Pseudaeromonas paramecii]|uniref:Alanine racemase n=1 Tax=Pseudaeromonas paramecii TaxID=2138166 RepID=A0ABP8Q491_9GAMM
MLTAEASLDLAALRHNLHVLRGRAPGAKLVAVVKADAYGHGVAGLLPALAEADALAVARLEEGLHLRKLGVTRPILLLEGCFCAADLQLAAQQELHSLIHSPEQLAAVLAHPLPKPLHAWIKLDTGMHRLGFLPEQLGDIHAQLAACPWVADEIGVASHFSCADEPGSASTQTQLACFISATADFPGPKSLANSAGLLYWPGSQFDWIRPGIALYGIAPDGQRCGADEGLRPVMSLRSRLIAVRDHPAGAPVSYGEKWCSDRPTRLGVVAMGYGDGYPRSTASGTPVLVNGRRVPLVGSVCMDMLMVDLGPDAQDQVGDPVLLWGPELPVEEVARHTGTIPYELVIKLTPRVVRTYRDSDRER